MANRLDASSRWLPAWTPSQAGLPLAAVATGDVCPHIAPLGQAPDTGSQEGPPGTVSRRGVPLTDLTGHIAVVAGGSLPASCSYADIVGCGPPGVPFHVTACSSASLWAMHFPLGPLGRGLSTQCPCPNVFLGKLIGTLRWLLAGCPPGTCAQADLVRCGLACSILSSAGPVQAHTCGPQEGPPRCLNPLGSSPITSWRGAPRQTLS